MNTWHRLIWNPNRGLLLLLGFGLVVRVVILSFVDQVGVRNVDERHYFQLASNILSGWGFAWGPDKPTSIRPPLYPAFLAATWFVIGHKSLNAIRTIQIVISLLTVICVYQLGRRNFSERVALIAAGMFCFYPSLLAFNYLLLTEVLFTFFLMLFLLGYVYLLQTEKPYFALATGIVLGLTALTRSILWPFPVILAPLTFLSLRCHYRQRILLVGAVLLGYVIVIAPWAVRNTEIQGVLTVVNSMGGLTLLMGNYEHTPLERAWDAQTLHGNKSIFVNLHRDHPDSHQWTEGQKEKWAQNEAFRFMLDHPVLTLKRTIVKFGSFWGLERTIIAGFRVYYHPPHWFKVLTTLIIPISYSLVMVLACLGLFLAAPEDKRVHIILVMIILFISGLHALVFGHSRYHLPLIPVLILYGASAVGTKCWVVMKNQLRSAAGPVVAYALLLVAWSREVMIIEAERVKIFFQSFMG